MWHTFFPGSDEHGQGEENEWKSVDSQMLKYI